MSHHLVKAAGGHLIKAAGGHLVKESPNSVLLVLGGTYHKDAFDGDPPPYDCAAEYAAVFSTLQSVVWVGIGATSAYALTGKDFVRMKAIAYRFDVSGYNGETLNAVTYTVNDYLKNGSAEFRVGFQTQASITPVDTWAWTTPAEYDVITGTAVYTHTLGTPIVLNDWFWITLWLSDYHPCSLPNPANPDFFRVGTNAVTIIM